MTHFLEEPYFNCSKTCLSAADVLLYLGVLQEPHIIKNRMLLQCQLK